MRKEIIIPLYSIKNDFAKSLSYEEVTRVHSQKNQENMYRVVSLSN